MSTVLVTGGAGFIGSHLADRLLAEGHRVISVDDLTTGRIANLVDARGYGKEFTFFNMDVRADGLLPLFERHRPEVVASVISRPSPPSCASHDSMRSDEDLIRSGRPRAGHVTSCSPTRHPNRHRRRIS